MRPHNCVCSTKVLFESYQKCLYDKNEPFNGFFCFTADQCFQKSNGKNIKDGRRIQDTRIMIKTPIENCQPTIKRPKVQLGRQKDYENDYLFDGYGACFGIGCTRR